MEREPRTSKNQPNIMQPLVGKDLFSFGSADDPCFGKEYSTKAPECRECGDNEICAIAMAQKAKLKRQKMSKEQSFMDEEDTDIDVINALKNLVITNRITYLKEVCKHIKKKFGSKDLLAAKALVKKAIKSDKTFKIIKTDGKSYIKAVKA